MIRGQRVAVAIPAYNVETHVADVISSLPSWVDLIVVVDDGSCDRSADVVAALGNPRVRLLRHKRNCGVGAAMRSAYRTALAARADVVVKMDGDGQMDPRHLRRIVGPLLRREADYAKGNRFYHLEALGAMPAVRRWGNVVLSLLAKAASGYWNISDPTNGYTAVRREALMALQLDHLHPRYFFEISLLIALGRLQGVVVDVPMPARYGSERSSMKLGRVLLSFPVRLVRGLVHRLYWRYFFYEARPASVFIVSGALLLLTGLAFGAARWYLSWATGTPQTPGTVLLAALPVLLGFQLLLQAVVLDVQDVPRVPLCGRWHTRGTRAPSGGLGTTRSGGVTDRGWLANSAQPGEPAKEPLTHALATRELPSGLDDGRTQAKTQSSATCRVGVPPR